MHRTHGLCTAGKWGNLQNLPKSCGRRGWLGSQRSGAPSRCGHLLWRNSPETSKSMVGQASNASAGPPSVQAAIGGPTRLSSRLSHLGLRKSERLVRLDLCGIFSIRNMMSEFRLRFSHEVATGCSHGCEPVDQFRRGYFSPEGTTCDWATGFLSSLQDSTSRFIIAPRARARGYNLSSRWDSIAFLSILCRPHAEQNLEKAASFQNTTFSQPSPTLPYLIQHKDTEVTCARHFSVIFTAPYR
jgi:hypothetical protein